MNTEERFKQNVLMQMRHDVEDAGGNEVFWIGRIDQQGVIVEARVGARGNSDSVLVNQNLSREGNVMIHNHPSGVLVPSKPDLSIAHNCSDACMGFYIVDNDLSRVYVVVEPIKPRVISPLDVDEVATYLGPEGPLAKQNPSYEQRPAQIELVRSVCGAFNHNKIGVYEAGTGVGKSFAYLLPSMKWALQNKERVVVSTGTINLQQQLIEKDIPLAQKIIGKDVKAVLLKGRQNYVCLRRLNDAANERDLFSEETEMFDRIYQWAKNSATGSRSDLSFMPPENVWTRINSESDACMGSRCPHREKCFVMKVRKEAADASIIVVNHHLLFADIESRMNGTGYDDTAVLPPYRRLVFDEAHDIENSATSFFSQVLNRFRINKQLNLMMRTKKSSLGGFLVQLEALSQAEDQAAFAVGYLNEVKDCLMALDETAMGILEYNSSIKMCAPNKTVFLGVMEKIAGLHLALGNFTGCIHDIIDGIDKDDQDVPVVWEAKAVLRRLEDSLALCKNFIDWEEDSDSVYWIEKKRLPPKNPGEEAVYYVQFNKTPLSISQLMVSGVFEPMDSVVCTSATLGIGNSFSFWMNRTGAGFVEEDRLDTGCFQSPFPYDRNMIFAVPSDAVSAVGNASLFQEYVENALPKLIQSAGGRTLVLFTSYDSLKSALSLRRMGYDLLKQGDDDRFRLLEQFKNDTSSVLFATDSFWEGVDVPGESLSQVIIVKLPFQVPTDPVFAARCEQIDKKGGTSFFELSVPQAVIKFRQGFGRLIRRGDDRGVVVVLDRRIVEKSYGRTFTNSVPKTRRMFNPLNDILAATEAFFEN